MVHNNIRVSGNASSTNTIYKLSDHTKLHLISNEGHNTTAQHLNKTL
jgi:hypothetical protein